MPRTCAHDVVGDAVKNASCCLDVSEAKEWLDAFFFDRYLHVQSKWSHPRRPHAWSSSVPFFVFDRRNATTIVRPHPLCTPLTCSMHSVPKFTFLSVTDIHTYIPTQNEMQSRISCLVLRRSATSVRLR